MIYTVNLPDGSTRTTTSLTMANAMAANSGGSVSGGSNTPAASSSGTNSTPSVSSGGGSTSSGSGWENRTIGGSQYTVPVGTAASWQPGQSFSNPGPVNSPGFNTQGYIESFVGNNYNTNTDGTYSSNWDKGQQQLFDAAYAPFVQNNPQFASGDALSQHIAGGGSSQMPVLTGQQFTDYYMKQPELPPYMQQVGNSFMPIGNSPVSFDYMLADAIRALGGGSEENLSRNADIYNTKKTEGRAIGGVAKDKPAQQAAGPAIGTPGQFNILDLFKGR